jgi:predicted DNA-binding protein (MmcQ/YjbR family)
MAIDWVRQRCLSFPHTTEHVQWGEHLVFKIGGKIYVIMNLEPGAAIPLSFKCSPDDFAELVEHPGVIPAPYLARAQWVALEQEDALPRAEIARLLRNAYDLVLAKLPRNARAALAGGAR